MKVAFVVLACVLIGHCRCDRWSNYLQHLIEDYPASDIDWPKDYLKEEKRKFDQLDHLIGSIKEEMNNILKQVEEGTEAMNGPGQTIDHQIKVLEAKVWDLQDFKTKQEGINERTNHQIATIKDELNYLHGVIEQGLSTSRSVYKRWGRKTCPGTSTLLYDGYAAGSTKYIKGAGANILCLPKNPDWNKFDTAFTPYAAKLYGIEYQIKSNTVYSKANFHNREMPCAVCETAKSTLMIPAKQTCPDGWSREYSGYLMSQATGNDRQPSEFICVDENIEAVSNDATDNDQGNMYLAESACGSLPCTIYPNGKEMTCIVCSK